MKLTKAQLDCLKGLEDKQGRISASRVVAHARKPSSPLHPLFPWNLKKAAMLHWIQRAREIIGHVTVLVQHETHEIKVPVYVRDRSVGGAQGYRSVIALRADPAAARESLVYTLEVAAGHVRRGLDLAGPLGLTREIDRLLAEIVGVQRIAKGVKSKKAA